MKEKITVYEYLSILWKMVDLKNDYRIKVKKNPT